MLVMIAFNENLPTIEPLKNGKTFARDDYIAQVINGVFLPYCCVPSFHHGFVHFFNRIKGTQWRTIGLYEGQAFGMSKVLIGGDKGAHKGAMGKGAAGNRTSGL